MHPLSYCLLRPNSVHGVVHMYKDSGPNSPVIWHESSNAK